MEETKKKAKINPMIIFGVIAVVAVAGFAFVNMNKSTEEVGQPSEANQEQAQTQPETRNPQAEVKEITMDAGAFYYSVKEIKVKKGEKVKIVMTSKDMMHDFNIDELNVKLPITKSGETNTVEFTADKVGTFEYYCSVGQHRKMGQVGNIIVE